MDALWMINEKKGQKVFDAEMNILWAELTKTIQYSLSTNMAKIIFIRDQRCETAVILYLFYDSLTQTHG